MVSAEKSETRRFETNIKTKTRGFETNTETKTKQTGLETSNTNNNTFVIFNYHTKVL